MRQHDGFGRHPELVSGSPGKGQQNSSPGNADMRQHDGFWDRHAELFFVILNLSSSS